MKQEQECKTYSSQYQKRKQQSQAFASEQTQKGPSNISNNNINSQQQGYLFINKKLSNLLASQGIPNESENNSDTTSLNLNQMDERINRLEQIIEQQCLEIEDWKYTSEQQELRQQQEITELQNIISELNRKVCPKCKQSQQKEIELKQQILKQSNQMLIHMKEIQQKKQEITMLTQIGEGMECKMTEHLSEVQILQEQLLNYEKLIQNNRQISEENLLLSQELKELEVKLKEVEQQNYLLRQMEFTYKEQLTQITEQQLQIWAENLELKSKICKQCEHKEQQTFYRSDGSLQLVSKISQLANISDQLLQQTKNIL